MTTETETEMDMAIRLLRTAENVVKDVRLALIRGERALGASEFSEDMIGHVKQAEELIKRIGDNAAAVGITLSVMRGDGNTDVEIIQGR